MKMFKQAVVRTPCKRLSDGISGADLGKPDYRQAIAQHDSYVRALEECGLEVTVLEADERFPDSTFVEDTAVLTERCAVICRPGAPSRKGEETEIVEQLKNFYQNLEYIESPGTLEGGDVMQVEDHFYIGLSGRTNRSGAGQFRQILGKFGYTGSILPLQNVLHLKTGLSYIEDNHLLAAGEFIDQPMFRNFEVIKIDHDEQYAANSIWVNGRVLLPQGFDKTRSAIEEAGYQTLVVDVSEFRKLDGGLSCLSLRF
jgi:dimethylargininase